MLSEHKYKLKRFDLELKPGIQTELRLISSLVGQKKLFVKINSSLTISLLVTSGIKDEALALTFQLCFPNERMDSTGADLIR